MKTKLTRTLAIITCAGMLSVMAAGCGDKQTASETSASGQISAGQSTAAADPDKMDWQLDTSPVTLKAYSDRSWFGDWSDPVARNITKKTGVTLDTKVPVKDETTESINLMIASNSFPDVMFLNGDISNPSISSLLKQNFLYSVDDLMDQYAPKLRDILNNEVGPEILDNFKYTDGKNYVLYYGYNTQLVSDIKNQMNQLLPIWLSRFNVRNDYFDEAGKPDTTTPEGFMSALEQMKAKHPDKLGLIVQNLGWFKTYFGIDSDYYVKDGNILSNIKNPIYLEMVKYCNQLYSKGLLAKDGFMNPPWDVLYSKWTGGETIGIMGNFADDGKALGNTGTTILSLPPFKTYSYTIVPQPWMGAVIPKSSKNAERTIRFLEYCASKEGNLDMGYGLKGDAFGSIEEGPQFSIQKDVKHQLFPEGKPVWFKEFSDAFNKDNSGIENRSGVFKHHIMDNWAIYDWFIPDWSKVDEKKQKYDEEMSPYVNYKPEYLFNLDGTSDEVVIKEKVSKLISDYEVKMVFAKSEAEVTSAYNEMLQKCDQYKLPQLEAEWTRQYKANMARLGK